MTLSSYKVFKATMEVRKTYKLKHYDLIFHFVKNKLDYHSECFKLIKNLPDRYKKERDENIDNLFYEEYETFDYQVANTDMHMETENL